MIYFRKEKNKTAQGVSEDFALNSIAFYNPDETEDCIKRALRKGRIYTTPYSTYYAEETPVYRREK